MVSEELDIAGAQSGAPVQSDGRPFRRSDLTLLKQILDRSATMKMIRRHMRQSGHRQAWCDLVGETVAGQARATAYRGGKLFVEVSSAALLQELSTFRKSTLLERLRQTEGYEGIVDIVFRHGSTRQ